MLSKTRATELGLEYIRRLRDVKYRETVFALLAKEFEVAKLDEAREGSIVQVVDPAVIPDRRSFPHRTLTIIGAALLAAFLASFWIVLQKNIALALERPERRGQLDLSIASRKPTAA